MVTGRRGSKSEAYRSTEDRSQFCNKLATNCWNGIWETTPNNRQRNFARASLLPRLVADLLGSYGKTGVTDFSKTCCGEIAKLLWTCSVAVRGKILGAGPSSFGRQQRLSEITIEPIKNWGAGQDLGTAVPPGPNIYRYWTCSSDHCQCLLHDAAVGIHAFCHAAPTIWNSLPADLTDNFNNKLLLVLNAASKRISTNFHSRPSHERCPRLRFVSLNWHVAWLIDWLKLRV